MANPAASSPLETMRSPEVTSLMVLLWKLLLVRRYCCACRDAMFVLMSKDMILSLNVWKPGIPFPGADNAVCASGLTKKLIDATSHSLRSSLLMIQLARKVG